MQDVKYPPSYRVTPSGPGYELVYATTALIPYILSLSLSGSLDTSFKAIATHEQALLKPLLGQGSGGEGGTDRRG